jgi:hypothetical protein
MMNRGVFSTALVTGAAASLISARGVAANSAPAKASTRRHTFCMMVSALSVSCIRGGRVIRTRRYLGLCAAALVASMSATHAGPCLDEIGTMEARIDARLKAIAAAGPPATAEAMEGPHSPQPTPRSIAGVLERMGRIRHETVQAIQQGLARARAADTNGDKAACEQALAEVQRNLAQ